MDDRITEARSKEGQKLKEGEKTLSAASEGCVVKKRNKEMGERRGVRSVRK